MRLLKLLLILFASAVSGPAVAGSFEDAFAAYNKGDYATTLNLLRPLAEQGHVRAQYNLGLMYNNGQGVRQDYAAAMSWYRKAAEQGHVAAQTNLGVMYDNGQGVPQDYAAAMSWWRKAAEQGHASAQYNLALMYLKGHGVPQDYVQAHLWLDLAASRYLANEQASRDRAINARDFVAARMTPAQIAEAQKLASEWKPKPER
jgi:TPR repeat protein